MKNQLTTTLGVFILIILSSFNFLLAQSNFEGEVIYKITYTDLPEEMEQMKGMLPQTMKIIMKGSKSRVEQTQTMGSNVIISDTEAKVGFIEMDVMGKKLRMSLATKDFDEDANAYEVLEYLDEKKTIAGYDCKKAIMKQNGGTEIEVFYTDQITNHAQREFSSLKGFPLEYNMSQNNITFRMTADVVDKKSVEDALFEKSEGFQDVTQDDLQKMMMGGG